MSGRVPSILHPYFGEVFASHSKQVTSHCSPMFFRIHTYSAKDLKLMRMNTYENRGVGGVASHTGKWSNTLYNSFVSTTSETRPPKSFVGTTSEKHAGGGT